jgi:benzoyl-CoA-dihydrodiol lyase
VDDGNSAVSLPEVPLLGVLPGTGGLTRLVDKRKVRRDLADVFCTTAEGIKGRRAQEWGLVDAVVPRSRFDEETQRLARELAAGSPPRAQKGVVLPPLEFRVEGDTLHGKHVTLVIDREHRWATLTLRGPAANGPADAAAIRAQGAAWWPLAAFRELDRALLHLRHNEETIGLLLLKTEGDLGAVLAQDRLLVELADDWFVHEVRLLIARVLRRLDLTARSLYALVEPGSCFGGTLLELALAADRGYVLDDPDHPPELAITALNGGAYLMSHGHGRLAVRFLGSPGHADALLAEPRRYAPEDALGAGLVTVVADDVDYEVEVRQAMEQRVAQSPDALTGMEASLRFPGTENGDSKIFGRLTAWQNWIFQRPNAVGERGALTLYGKPERPSFDWRRT